MCLAIPGQIESIQTDGSHAVIDVMGVRRQVSMELVRDDQPAVGDWVLIHVGFAMSMISAEHAAEQIRVLTLLGADEDAKAEVEGYAFGDEVMP